MGVQFTSAELETINRNLDEILTIINGKATINLTKLERQSIQGVAAERLPYVQVAYNSLIPANPQFKPPFSSEEDATNDFTYMEQHNQISPKLGKVAEVFSDHQLAAGALAFEYMRDFYDVAKRGAERNVPGADSVVDALSPLFEVTNPTPPMPTGGNG